MAGAINDSGKRLFRVCYPLARLVPVAIMMVVLTACSGMPPLPDAGTAEAQVFQSRCGTCHGLPHPHRHTFAQWQHVLAFMEMRIRERGMQPLGSEDRNAILRYLKNNAREAEP